MTLDRSIRTAELRIAIGEYYGFDFHEVVRQDVGAKLGAVIRLGALQSAPNPDRY